MAPALSIIFLTTLSGAGYGLLVWLGVSLAVISLRGQAFPALVGVQLAALIVGLLLSSIGLVSSMGHLGKPFRAWRTFAQWRTSWLSREGVLAFATMLSAVVVGALLHWGKPGETTTPLLAALGMLLALCALGTLASTAMIYVSLKQVPTWRHPLVVPIYLLFALLTGLALLFALMLAMLGNDGPDMMLVTLVIVAVLLMALKWLYWYESDRDGPLGGKAVVRRPLRRATLPQDPPAATHYIARGAMFQLARDHGLRLRALSSALVIGGPLLAFILLALGGGSPAFAIMLAMVLMLGGAFVERWLFFAQARQQLTQPEPAGVLPD